MTRERVKTHAVWLTLYAALFSAVAFAGTPSPTEAHRAAISPVLLDARAPAFNVRPVTLRVDI